MNENVMGVIDEGVVKVTSKGMISGVEVLPFWRNQKPLARKTMSSGEGKSRGAMADPSSHHHQQAQPQPQPQPQQFQSPYGTFGVPDYSQPAIGFPQPVAPPGVGVSVAPSAPAYPPYSAAPQYYAHGYQVVPGIESLMILPESLLSVKKMSVAR
ncbi:hypothetical protein GW17_00012876 [Ensete ventricosum]|nr:hypothetical protein GW17_00012876 [Ensete ventricosum]